MYSVDSSVGNTVNITIDQLRSECIQLTHERDQAINCIYEVREALANGDPGAAMESVINYEFHLKDKE